MFLGCLTTGVECFCIEPRSHLNDLFILCFNFSSSSPFFPFCVFRLSCPNEITCKLHCKLTTSKMIYNSGGAFVSNGIWHAKWIIINEINIFRMYLIIIFILFGSIVGGMRRARPPPLAAIEPNAFQTHFQFAFFGSRSIFSAELLITASIFAHSLGDARAFFHRRSNSVGFQLSYLLFN